ncbi:MAG: cupin domain-containing protein [Gammaproteobacteria bacterium]|nr:cupin domain-containing protein [Gammaproteobacteria bacterium]
MGTVLNPSDFAAARAVRSATLKELGVAPICLAPGQEDPGHSHTVVEEVVIVQKGEGRIQIENDTYDLCAGSVAVVPAGQFHAMCNVGTGDFEAVAIFNANVDRDAVVLKTREEHFDIAPSEEMDVEALKAELAEVGRTVRRLQRKLAKG